jgi:hypothetical protein
MSNRLTLLIILGALTASVLRRPAREHAIESQTYEDIYYLPPGAWLPVLSLGHQSALADLLWIRALVYVGDEFGNRHPMRHVFDYTDAMLELEPDFEAVYHWIASAGVYRTVDVTRQDLLRTISLLEHGVERLPESGQLHWDLGATLAFESAPFAESDAEREDWRLRGIEHLMIATRLGAAPQWMVLSNSSMLMRVGASERAVEHLEEMYATVEDPAMRAEVGARIAALRGEAHAAAFLDETERLEEERLRALPYVHPSLYFLVGPRPPVDTEATLRDGFAAHVFDGELTGETVEP